MIAPNFIGVRINRTISLLRSCEKDVLADKLDSKKSVFCFLAGVGEEGLFFVSPLEYESVCN